MKSQECDNIVLSIARGIDKMSEEDEEFIFAVTRVVEMRELKSGIIKAKVEIAVERKPKSKL